MRHSARHKQRSLSPTRANSSPTLSKLVGLGALIASWSWTQAHAEGRVEVVIRETTRPAGMAPVLVDVTFINRGDGPVFLHKPSTPFGRTDSELNGDQFLVIDEAGEVLPYRGSGAGYWGPVRLSHFVVVAPGDSVHKEVNLSQGYDMDRGGDFKVRFHASLDRAPDSRLAPAEEHRAFVRNSQLFVESNEITIHVGPSHNVSVTPAKSFSGVCTAPELEKLNEALSTAANKSHAAYGFMGNVYQIFQNSDGGFSYRYTVKRRFERWFGKPPEGSPLPGEPGWYQSDSGDVKSALGAVMSRLSLSQGSKLSPKCGCPGAAQEVLASAEDHNPYWIRFCPAFFNLPVDGPWTSRAGVLVHEASHFYDHSGDGRSDYAYGKEDAEELARRDRYKAVRNADNIEFFVMDTTPYED